MTATLTQPELAQEEVAAEEVAAPTGSQEGRPCALPGCTDRIPADAHSRRLYCDFHAIRRNREGTALRGEKPKDEKPRSVDIKIGVTPPRTSRAKPASDQARVEAACVSYLQLLAGIFVASGDDTCAATVAKATPQIARAIADLSKYHPQLVKILAPVEATGEGAAWIALSIAVFPVVVGILSHHGLLDARRSEILGTMSTSAEMFARSVKPEDDVVNPANDAQQPAAA